MKFLRFMVTQRGIEVNPAQVKFVLKTPTSNNKKELQRLTGHLTTLGPSTFSWTYECKKAFEVIKRYLTKPLILSSLKSTEQFYMYLAVSNCTISLVMQSPIGEPVEQAICINFLVSNNDVEYEAMLSGLDLALILATAMLEVKRDSQLIFRQIQQEYETKDEHMENGNADTLAGITAILPINGMIMLPNYLKVAPSITPEPIFLWAYRTTSKRLTRATPFALAYGMEVIIPIEIDMSIAKTIVQDQKDNDEELIRQLD
ncbi:hypothetical protein AAG906_011146 [Vitis piasezkii]